MARLRATAPGSITWKPYPPVGPPSACNDRPTTRARGPAAAAALFPMAARSTMHGPTPSSPARVSTTRAPAARSRAARRRARSHVKADSVYPDGVCVPVVSHALRPAPMSTSRLTTSGCRPLPPSCPGSRTTTAPASPRLAVTAASGLALGAACPDGDAGADVGAVRGAEEAGADGGGVRGADAEDDPVVAATPTDAAPAAGAVEEPA